MMDGSCIVTPEIMVARFNNAFPSYRATWTRHGGRPRYELVTTDDSHPWCVISEDAAEIWRALKEVPRSA
jgi:hypothetical protein